MHLCVCVQVNVRDWPSVSSSINLHFKNIYCFVCGYFMCMYSWVPPRGQKKALSPLDLELWKAVSHHMGAGYQTWVFCKNKCS